LPPIQKSFLNLYLLPACLPLRIQRNRELFRLPEDVDISLTFGCKEPMSGTHLKLEGMGAFDAAVHCASVAAAERQQKVKKSYSTGNLGSTPALANAQAADGQQQMARSQSNSSIPAANLSAASPAAAGLSAAPGAAQDRRRRFQGQQQQRGAAGRSQSFSVGSAAPSGRSSSGAEPPAAFRNILSMLGGTGSGSSVSPFAAAAAQEGSAGNAAAGAAAAAAAAAGEQAEALRSSSGSPEPATAAVGSSSSAERVKKGRLSLRNISELTDVPEIDETVAIGSFSGKFKLQLKAFSRKVARSLSFTNKVLGAGSSAAAAAGGLESYGSAGYVSGSSSRAASMSSPRLINYAAGAVSPSPRSMTNSPLPPPCPSPRLERVA
jgi:hypothetical protein